ncbi:phage integrase N-terminal SAM-like domain-containing protein [Reichenbachiella carrageenanivorans]|uniref:Phage integrase N-terminal SAM-like domain-containing protein n=1 Tax=Reichenbachiella carrageenanivorans TaxID=2979869 RepID=A0ABY6D0W0_9BACT|nr:site-specific integrase [Reichenbachiella carrageenanivorans]UXX79791.1 phage integrase N-terminal SAM-like domain-containing protein [Reichenbachiella carrageenanivorans]
MKFKEYLQSNGYSRTTIKGHVRNVENLHQWAVEEGLEIEQITYQDLLAYTQQLNKRGTSKRTVSLYMGSIKHYYNHLLQAEIISHHPAQKIQIKGIKRRMVYDILKPIELEAVYHKFITNEPQFNPRDNATTKQLRQPSFQMHKVMLGLLIYQGINSTELIDLKPEDIKLREGMIYVPRNRRSNERELKLEAVQILEMQEYLLKTRAEILAITQKQSEQLFISSGKSPSLYHAIRKLTKTLKDQNGRIEDLQQIRASVIVKWLNNYNLRQAQYMAGHRFVSSTEKYKQSDLEDLKEDINKFHPLN